MRKVTSNRATVSFMRNAKDNNQSFSLTKFLSSETRPITARHNNPSASTPPIPNDGVSTCLHLLKVSNNVVSPCDQIIISDGAPCLPPFLKLGRVNLLVGYLPRARLRKSPNSLRKRQNRAPQKTIKQLSQFISLAF